MDSFVVLVDRNGVPFSINVDCFGALHSTVIGIDW